MKKIFLILLLTNISLLYKQSSSSIKLQITPPIFEAEVKPGAERSFDITVINNSAKRLVLKGYVNSFQIDRQGSPYFLDDPFQPYSCQSWIDLDPKQIQVMPGEVRKARVTIRVPADARGGNYATVLFDVDEDTKTRETTSVGLTIRTGTLILLTVKNTVKLSAEIRSLEVAEESEKSVFAVLLKNNSNQHIKPQGSLVIFEDKKRVIDRLNFEEGNFIMPNSERVLQCIWDNPRKREKNKSYHAECRFTVKGLGKSLIERKEFTTLGH